MRLFFWVGSAKFITFQALLLPIRYLTISIVGIPAIPTCSIDSEATQFAKSTALRGSACQ